MKIVKRLLLSLLILIVLLVGSAIALPYLFKDKLVALAKEEINKNVLATVDFQGVDLSLLRSFPNFSLELQDYSVQGINEFEGIQLAAGKSASFTLDLMSVISSTRPVEVKSVILEEPVVHVVVLADGKANYDIAVPSETPEDETASEDYSNVLIQLQEYSISNGKLIYDDRSIDVYADARGINHQGSGDLTIDVYDLDTNTEVDSLTVQQSGITYLKNAHATLDAIFNIEQAISKYNLKENELAINDLKLTADGFVQLVEDDINMELVFSSPQNEFKNFLSMIPNAYIEGYENVKADGKFTLSGDVKGTYNGDREEYPSFRIESSITEGNVQYPGLPLGIRNINTQVKVNSPSSDFDDLAVDVPRFAFTLGQNPFQGSFSLRTPISDPDVKTTAKGVINLKELAQAFPMEGIQELSGIINADLRVDTRLSYIEKEQYERVNMDGRLQVNQVSYQSEGLPAVQIKDMQMAFTPQNVRLDNFQANLGKSDIQAQGAIDNILAYFSPEKTMKGNLKVRSDYFLADEWMPAEETASTPAAAPAEETEIFDRFDFTLDASIQELVYDVYTIRNGIARGNMTPNRLSVSQLSGQIGDSDFSASGTILNVFDYLFENGVLGGRIALNSRLLNLNQFMEEEEGASTSTEGEAYSVIPVPPNIDMTIDANIGKVAYTNMALEDVKGEMVIAEQAIMLDNVTARGLGGAMAVSGSYDTKDMENPAFRFKYDLQKLDFRQAFSTFNTFQQLAPIGNFITGTFSSTMIMDGKLGSDLMPKLESINAEGFLETLNGMIVGFAPAQAIGEKLNIDYLKSNINITNTRNWFTVENGTLTLQEYDAKVKDIAMKIGGTYNITNKMNLDIRTKIPRKLLEQNAIGAAASSGFGLLQKEASKLGLNIKQGEFINVLINLTGDIQKPKVGLKLLGAEGEGSVADAAKGQVKEEAQKAIDEGKQLVKETTTKAVDSLKTVASQKAEQAKKELEEKARQEAQKAIGNVVDTATQKKAEELLEGAKKEGADKIKENLDKWNPFGKKKKDGGG
ncbi:MAG: hypothetical protein KDD19_26530 [Phaeodactylibacter sp.]|nr:hypothetical protein [Phaeodactylibacter sp.]MCB9052463.1 hypothetical protein [Lewinellaceae bacterium]